MKFNEKLRKMDEARTATHYLRLKCPKNDLGTKRQWQNASTQNPNTKNARDSGISYTGVLSVALWPDIPYFRYILQILFLFQHWQAALSNSLCAFCLPLPYEQATTNPCQRCPTAEKMCLHDIFSFKLFNVTNNYYMRWKFLMTESTPVWSLNWCMDIMTW